MSFCSCQGGFVTEPPANLSANSGNQSGHSTIDNLGANEFWIQHLGVGIFFLGDTFYDLTIKIHFNKITKAVTVM